MPLAMASAPRPDDPPGAAHAASPWATQVSEAEPVRLPAANAPAQLPLFPSSALPPAPSRAARARLPGRIKALLGKARAADAPAPDPGGPSDPAWPDSFFDAEAGREP